MDKYSLIFSFKAWEMSYYTEPSIGIILHCRIKYVITFGPVIDYRCINPDISHLDLFRLYHTSSYTTPIASCIRRGIKE